MSISTRIHCLLCSSYLLLTNTYKSPIHYSSFYLSLHNYTIYQLTPITTPIINDTEKLLRRPYGPYTAKRSSLDRPIILSILLTTISTTNRKQPQKLPQKHETSSRQIPKQGLLTEEVVERMVWLRACPSGRGDCGLADRDGRGSAGDEGRMVCPLQA